MSGIQRLLRILLPSKVFANIEAESRAWKIECPCGFSCSIWDAGGIRYKAAGSPRRLRHCSQCGRTIWHVLKKSNAKS